jgi:precorrin-6B C5,15-methyltransferase / cobalt-precorrin-6B C5,C15-methyltransferase
MAGPRTHPRAPAPAALQAERAISPVLVVGIGDDGTSGLSQAARSAVAAATLLCGGERHLAFFPDHPAERFVVRANLEALVARLAARGPAERPVVLASGDPCYFGIAPYLAARLGRERVRVEPHVSSVQLAFARLSVSWQDATVLSAHGRPLAPLVPRALAARKVAFLTDERNTPAAIARALLAAGRTDGEAHVFEHLGGDGEHHTACQLSDLPDCAFAALNVLVLLGDSSAASPPHGFGLAETAYAHRDGQITKAEVRAVSLSKLRLRPDAIVWDVGAGCGSVSLEAAALARGGEVYAVERDAAQRAHLHANAATRGAPSLRIIAGEAPAALAALPDPDAVFLGGSGGRLADLLACVTARLKPGGRLVANFATLEHLSEATVWLRAARWQQEVVQLSVARGADLGGLTRLAPLPPVFILTAWPPPTSRDQA